MQKVPGLLFSNIIGCEWRGEGRASAVNPQPSHLTYKMEISSVTPCFCAEISEVA